MKRRNGHRINASAMGYAIAFMLLIGLFTSGVLFITATHKRIETHFLGQEYLLFDNYTSLLIGAERQNSGTFHFYHPSGDTSQIVVKPWGFMRCVVATTFHGGRSLQREALTAKELKEQLPSLYIPDQKNKTALAGTTKLEGEVFISERGLKRANITGKPYQNDKLNYGMIYKSERYLPALKNSVFNYSLNDVLHGSTQLSEIPSDSIFSFKNETSLIKSTGAISLDQSLAGNLVVQSFDQIIVRSNAKLKNIILIAPNIVFEIGFHGSVQAIASRQIICEEDVQLIYPSCLMLFETEVENNVQNRIVLEGNAQVLGGVLLVSKKPDFRNPVLLDVQDARIGGLVYNQGESEIRGEIIGSLYTNNLIAHAGGGAYGGHLVDALISSTQLPDNFIMPDWLRDSETDQPTIVAWL